MAAARRSRRRALLVVAIVLVGVLLPALLLSLALCTSQHCSQRVRMSAYNARRAQQAQQAVVDHCRDKYGFEPEITGYRGSTDMDDDPSRTAVDDAVVFTARHDGRDFHVEADYATHERPMYKVPDGPVDAGISSFRDSYQAPEIIADTYRSIADALDLPAPVSTNADTIDESEVMVSALYDGGDPQRVFGATMASRNDLELLYPGDVDIRGALDRADRLLAGAGPGNPENLALHCVLYQMKDGADAGTWKWGQDRDAVLHDESLYFPEVTRALRIDAPLSQDSDPKREATTLVDEDTPLLQWGSSASFAEQFTEVAPQDLPDDLCWGRRSSCSAAEPVGPTYRRTVDGGSEGRPVWMDTVYIPDSVMAGYLAQGHGDPVVLVHSSSEYQGSCCQRYGLAHVGGYYVLDALLIDDGDYLTVAA